MVLAAAQWLLLVGAALIAGFPAESFAEGECPRIVSLAPSVTETLFGIGLGDHVVGRTKFCRYPPVAEAIPTVGGFFDPSVEMIVSLKPSHVVALKESLPAVEALGRLGIPVLVVDHSSVRGIQESIRTLGAACGVSARAEALLEALRAREERVRAGLGQLAHATRTLVVVGRAKEGSRVTSLYVSGSDGFYSDVLRLAGAQNVNEKPTVSIPIVSPEGLRALNPDAVVEIVSEDDEPEGEQGAPLLPRLLSQHGGPKKPVFVLSDDFASVPGPRYIELVEKLAALLHGELGAGE